MELSIRNDVTSISYIVGSNPLIGPVNLHLILAV